jgi:hypothetical protein
VEAWLMPVPSKNSTEHRLMQSNKTGFVYDKTILGSFPGFDQF